MNTCKLYLGSGGYRTDAMREQWRTGLDDFLSSVKSFVFIPDALADHKAYAAKLVELGFHAGRQVHSLHEATDPQALIRQSEAIFVGGGNSFRLLHSLQQKSLLPLIAERIKAGIPYIGISAGTNLACPTIMTSNDMPIVHPTTLEALDLIPFQINPHYVAGRLYHEMNGEPAPMGGETRDDRIREYHEMNALPVLGLYEGVALRIDEQHARLEGARGARLFTQGGEAAELPSGSELSFLLEPS